MDVSTKASEEKLNIIVDVEHLILINNPIVSKLE